MICLPKVEGDRYRMFVKFPIRSAPPKKLVNSRNFYKWDYFDGDSTPWTDIEKGIFALKRLKECIYSVFIYV